MLIISRGEKVRLTLRVLLFWRWRYAKHVMGASVTTSPLCSVLFVWGLFNLVYAHFFLVRVGVCVVCSCGVATIQYDGI